jgi:cation:H+ antiporter
VLWLGLALIIAGIVLLWTSADPFVVAAVRMARIWGVSPVLVGALVIGFGTSAPELMVSAAAAVRGELAESVSNVVGSNAANLSLVLGVAAVISPVVGQLRVIRREGAVTLVAMAALMAAAWDNALARWEGILLVVGMAVVTVFLVNWSRQDVRAGLAGASPDPDTEGDPGDTGRGAAPEVGRALASLVGIVAGAWLLVEGGSRLADLFNLADGFVGVTIFALGTSLPELVTAIAAARRKANDLIIGNLLGSNLFNSLLVVGVAGVLGAGPVGQRRVWEYVVMMGIGLTVVVMAILRSRFGRSQGAILLGMFGLFIVVVGTNATV